MGAVVPEAGHSAANGEQSGLDEENLPAHGEGNSRGNRDPGRGRLRGQLSSG